MQVILYVLREDGRPLSYTEVKARSRPEGRLVLGTWGNPEVHAKLLGAWPEMNAPKLSHARVIRIGNGCILLFGQQWQPSHPYPRQTWLCALSEEAGEAALRKIRPPRPADFPFGGLEDDDRPD
ncbi:hypothetical protein LJR039_004333 [Pseudorhodoferax sp. LjRoot39]|uniref:hypothetical protein n=1 Tax=Pseudorhodoferax sp. LjRoot39 TaxID=3342328 RepID=UPI003ECE2D1B